MVLTADGNSGQRPESSATRSFSEVLNRFSVVDESGPRGLRDVRTCLLVEQTGPAMPQTTAVGMALVLGRIRRLERDAIVGFFPDLDRFARMSPFELSIRMTYDVAAHQPGRLVAVGAPPAGPEGLAGSANLINAFTRHPRASFATAFATRRSLWPVSALVGTIDAFRSALLGSHPALVMLVDAIAGATSVEDEPRAVAEAAARAPRVPLSSAIANRQSCLVVRLTSVVAPSAGNAARTRTAMTHFG